MLFSQYFREQATKNPLATALYYQSENQYLKLTYQGLDEQSTQIAAYFSSVGIKEGTCIAVYCHRGPFYPLIFLACAKLGAIYVPLPTSEDKQKLKQIITNAQIEFIFTEPDLLKNAQEFNCPQVLTPIDFSKYTNTYPHPQTPNPNLYLIYSSGTTNKPKGIPIGHAGLPAWGDFINATINPSAPPHILGNTSVGFDPHIWEYVMAWCTGGTLYFTDDSTHSSASTLLPYMVSHNISDATFTPTLLNLFISRRRNGALLLELQKAGLKRLYMTGEALSKNILKFCDEAQVSVYNCYGPSELTFGFSCKKVTEGNVDKTDSVEIGFSSLQEAVAFVRPLESDSPAQQPVTSISLLGPTFPIRGELLISSPYMTPGYHLNPQLSEARFTTVPMNGQNYRLYATEDIVEVEDGKFYFRGRTGDRIKRNLIFINLETIREVLKKFFSQNTTLCDAIVIRKNSKDYLFVFASQACDQDALKKFILTSLTNNEVPDYFLYLPLEEFPRNINGKIDKKRLEQRAHQYLSDTLSDSLETFIPPTDLEKLEETVSTALFLLFNQIASNNAEAFFANKNTLIVGFFKRSIEWAGFTAKLINYFGQDIPDKRLALLSFRQLQLTLIRPYLLKHTCENLHRTHQMDVPPLFCIPPVTGDTNEYKESIGDNTPAVLMPLPTVVHSVYSNIKLNALCQEAFYGITLYELAQTYADCMLLIQPQGPHRVLGWSFGGTLLLAMLNTQIKLHRSTLIDTPDPRYLTQLSKADLRAWLIQFGNFLLKKFRQQKVEIYQTLPETISFQIPEHLADTALIKYFFDQLISLIPDINNEDMIYFINMLKTARQNMLSVYDFKQQPGLRLTTLKLFRSETGLLGKHVCLPENWHDHVEQLDHSIVENTDHFTIVAALKDSLLAELQRKDQITDAFSRLRNWNIPQVGSSFIPRADVFNRIITAFENKVTTNTLQSVVALVSVAGIGGAGKTKMAQWYAIQRPDYQYRIWLEAETPSKLFSEYQALGKFLRGRPETSPEELIAYIKNFFNSRKNWLIVYDNVDDPKSIENFLPQTGGDILVTSRLSRWDHRVDIEGFTEEQALEYFDKICKTQIDDLNNLKKLIKLLGYLPLAVAQAAAFIAANRTYTVTRYLNEFLADKPKYLADNTLPNFCHHEAVRYTWKKTVDLITVDCPDAFNLLNYLCYFYPTGIKIEYLAHLFQQKTSLEYVKDAEASARCETAINFLDNYFMIQISPDGKTISVHRLVQTVMWEEQKQNRKNIFYLQGALESIIATCGEKVDSLILGGVANEPSCMEAIIICYENMRKSHPRNTIILQALGCCYLFIKQFEKAEACFKSVIAIDAHGSVFFEYGQALFLHKKFDAAIEAFKSSIACDDNQTNYFSEMELDMCHPRIQAEIKRNGVVQASSKYLSYLFLIQSYLIEENDKPQIAQKYLRELKSLLKKEPHPFVLTVAEELEQVIFQKNLGANLCPPQQCRLL